MLPIAIWMAIIGISILGTIFWILMLIDCVKRENYEKKDDKMLWVLIVALAGVIGAAIYYFLVKRKYDNVKK